MSLSSYRIPFLIPYFVEMQRKSFLNFLNTGLIYELSRKNPMYDSLKEFQIIFYPEYYQLGTPEYTAKTAILKFKTYSSKLYIPVQLTNFKNKQLKLHWIILGNLPLMTKRGNFIVNGSPRIIINQIVRSPGIYYKQTTDQRKRKTYYGDLISQRGAWLRLEIDKKKRVWIHMKKTRKIPALIFFKAVGISDFKIKESTKYSYFLEASKALTENIETENYQHPDTIQNSLLWIYAFVYPQKKKKGEITLKKAKKFLFRKFFSHRTYDLGYSGRNQLNKKFNSDIESDICVLTPQDLLFALDYLIKFEQSVGLADDIDHLKNRRVRTSGELIQNQLGTGFIRLEKLIRDKTQDSTSSVLNIFSTKPVDGALREFFGSSPLSQFMDQTNPLAELTHKRRVSSLGPGGVSRETAGMEVRGIHPSHYGRICPIETPEGRNAGLVNSITTLARVNDEGFIKTPFYPVYQGQVQKYESAALFSAAQEEHIIIAPSDLKTNYFHFLPYCTIPVRASGDFKKLRRNDVQYMSISPIQMISIATSLIPFLEHDDANRALMGSNMQRQAVPLILPERPAIGTGLEARIVADSGHGLQAKTSGIVCYTSNRNILVTNFWTKPAVSKKVASRNINYPNTISESYVYSKLTNDQAKSINFKKSYFQKSLNQIKFGKDSLNTSISNKTSNIRPYKLFGALYLKHKMRRLGNNPRSRGTFGMAQNANSRTFQSNVATLYQVPKQIKFLNQKNTLKYKATLYSCTKYNVFGTDPFYRLENHFIYLSDLINHNKNEKFIILYKKPNLAKWIGFKKSSFIKNPLKNNPLNSEQIKSYPEHNNENTLQGTLSNSYSFETIRSKTISNNQDILYVTAKYFEQGPETISSFNNAATLTHFSPKDQVQAARLVLNSNVCFSKKFYHSKKPFLSKNVYPKNNLYSETDTSRNTLNYIRNFIKKFRNECVELSFLQIFIQKKNLKHIFLFSSPNWQNFNTKKFAKLRFFKKTKSSNFFKTFDFKSSKITGFKKTISENLVQKPVSKKYYNQNILKNYSIFQSAVFKRKFCQNPPLLSIIDKPVNHVRMKYRTPFQRGEQLLSNKKQVLLHGVHAPVKNEAPGPLYYRGKGVNKNISNFILRKNKIKNLKLKSEFKLFNTTTNHVVLPYQHSNQNTCMHQTSLVDEGEWVQKGDLLADGAASVGGELALGKSILVAYMPWEGYNFEDAILVNESLIYNDIYTSIHIEKYKIEISDTQYGLEQITSNIPNITVKHKSTLSANGVIKLGSWVTQGDILVGKVTPILKRKISGHEKLLADILGTKKNTSTVRDTSLRVPKHVSGRIVHIELLENESVSLDNFFQGPSRVHIYVAEKRKLQVGDKMSGRHGNKGIISNILPRQDMPYLADGTPIDMVLNPLGVPSRMNVGQIFECLLGLASKELNEHFRISCFDEMSGPEASRSFTYSKLFEARVKTQKHWLFNPNFPGKMQLFDGRSGECFHQKVTVGQPYMLKLVHLVDEKIHARSTGPYSLVTQQPLRGRSKHGGQRLGEMEVWALEGFGAAYTLQELLTAKSDDVKGRHQVMQAILEQKSILLGTPESFKVLLSELQSLCLNIGVYSINNWGTRKKIDIMQLSEVQST